MEPQPITDTQEQTVGISQYILRGPQLLGIQKYLVSDFIVNQIDQQGNVVLFASKPDFNKHHQRPAEKKPEENEQTAQPLKIDEALQKDISDLLSKQAFTEISTLYERLDIGQKVGDWSIKIPSPESKQQRSLIHNFVREKLHNIDSKTQPTHIVLFYSKTFKRVKRSNDYAHFKMLKSNIDTMSALFKLSKIMGVNQKLMSVAGLKDKRGITTQKVSLYNSQPSVFNKFYKVAFRNREIWLGDLQFHQKEQIALGQLQGNRFSIIIRFTKGKNEVIVPLEQNLNVIATKGFINYFGMQRFGRGTTRTHTIGIQILKKNWRGVVQTLLFEDAYDENVNRQKKELYEQGDYKKAERLLSNKHMIQKHLFSGLARIGTNFCSVFESLPRNSRMIYGHSLQSFIWNKVVSRRIKEFGTELVIGDLVAERVVKEEKQINELQADKPQEEQPIIEDQAEVANNESYQVAVITTDNINQYSLKDIVVPMVGSTTQLPQTCIVKKFIDEELNALGLSFESFHKGLPKSLLLPGGYRKLLAQPQNVKWEFHSFDKKSEELQSGFYYLEQKQPQKQGALFALRIQFDLLKSSYATMLIREVLKMSSAFQIQQQLNKIYNQQSEPTTV